MPSLGLSNKAVFENHNTEFAMAKSKKEPYPEESHFTAIELTGKKDLSFNSLTGLSSFGQCLYLLGLKINYKYRANFVYVCCYRASDGRDIITKYAVAGSTQTLWAWLRDIRLG